MLINYLRDYLFLSENRINEECRKGENEEMHVIGGNKVKRAVCGLEGTEAWMEVFSVPTIL